MLFGGGQNASKADDEEIAEQVGVDVLGAVRGLDVRRAAARSPSRWAWMSLGPRPMYSCSKRLTPSQIAASSSPTVLIAMPHHPPE